jgi:hypothetical protein
MVVIFRSKKCLRQLSSSTSTRWRACLGRRLSDSNNSIPYFGFSVSSVIWGVCFSLKANPNHRKRMDSGTVLAQGDTPAFGKRGERLLRRQADPGYSVLQHGFSLFSLIWKIFFSLKANTGRYPYLRLR